MILLPLLLAISASAADTPKELKPSRSFAQGVIDSSFTVIATPTESSVNIWSLATGKQVGHVDLPTYKHVNDKDLIDVLIHSVRPESKLLLVSTKHWITDEPTAQYWSWTRSEYAVYLVSYEDAFAPIKLWSGSGSCGSYGIKTTCAGPQRDYDRSKILDAKPEVVVGGLSAVSGKSNAFRKTEILMAFDLKGRKLFENEASYAGLTLVKGVEKSYPPFDEKKEEWFARDAQSCRLQRSGKTVLFLEGCTNDDYPSQSSDPKLVSSIYNTKHEYKVWDPATGALKLTFAPTRADGWTTDSIWTELRGGKIATVAKHPNDGTRVEVWDPRSGRLLAIGSGAEFADAAYPKGADSRLIFDRNDGKASRTVVIDLDDAPAAPVAVAAPKLDVDEIPAAVKANPDAYAIVIGVEKYRSAGVPLVDYAARDAKTMAAYLGAMGFDAKNTAVLTDAEAGKADFDKYFGKWLKNRVGPKSRVFIYYAGHGAPNPTTGAGYLMPYEADPAYLEETAYPVTQLYTELAKLPTKDITVVLDACFSGQGERSLIAKGTRPLVPTQATRGPENAAVIAAASGSQISASDHEARHGLLTYHLLAGLHGAADADGDGIITTSEIFSYARPAVERAAKLQNVEQTPTTSGDTGAAGTRAWLTVKKP